jgi:hypothetical protein
MAGGAKERENRLHRDRRVAARQGLQRLPIALGLLQDRFRGPYIGANSAARLLAFSRIEFVLSINSEIQN